MQKDAIKILNQYKKEIWKEIQTYLKDPSYPNSFKIPPKYKELKDFHWKTVKEYPRRKGKYLRPTLLMITCETMGGNKQQSIKTAAAMQISEDWLLIHDDIEDNSLMRRGKPTLHKMFDTELAINAGDALHVIMWNVLTQNHKILGYKKTHELTDEFHRILVRTIIGQTTEIYWTKRNKINLTTKDWFFIADGKTSYYTIAGPMRLGAMIANASQKQLDSIAKFGIQLGRCFQLVDDILDITSNFGGLKKQTGNDIYEGKRTVMLSHLLKNAKPSDKKKLLSILNKDRENKTQDEVSWVINKMHSYGSIDYAKKLAKKLKGDSNTIFEKDLKFLSRQPARRKLQSLINFVLERNH